MLSPLGIHERTQRDDLKAFAARIRDHFAEHHQPDAFTFMPAGDLCVVCDDQPRGHDRIGQLTLTGRVHYIIASLPPVFFVHDREVRQAWRPLRREALLL